jgi:hypothetical protein
MNWTEVEGALCADPYLAWTQATQFAGHAAMADPATKVPVLVELADAHPLEQLAQERLMDVPGLYRMGGARYCTGFVERSRLAELESKVTALEFALPLAGGVVDQVIPRWLPPSETPSTRVVIGIIDRGCAFLNQNFRKSRDGPASQETRLIALWDQAHAAEGRDWKRPPGVGYGRELRADDINGLIATMSADRPQSEEQIYRRLKHLIGSEGEVLEKVHGTHVMDTAAGLAERAPSALGTKPPAADGASGCGIVFVSIPELAPDDTTGASPGAFILDGVRYILDRAGPDSRVVINMSIGVQGGPHDGTSLTERALQEILDLRTDLCLVIAAGNGAQERCNATGRLQPGDSARLVWSLMPNDVTDSFVEIWMREEPEDPKVPARGLSVVVTPPRGPSSDPVTAGKTYDLLDHGAAALRTSHRIQSSLGKDAMVLLSMAPVDGKRRAASPGRWTIDIRNDSPVGGQTAVFDAWIQRDEPPFSLRAPLQSSFDDFGPDRQGEGTTLNNLASIHDALAVGACRLSDGQETVYSARPGRVASARARRDVDVLAAADESELSVGLFAAAVRSGENWRIGGTSVAAPRVTRYVVNRLVEGQEDFAPLPGGIPAAALKAAVLASLRRPKEKGRAIPRVPPPP